MAGQGRRKSQKRRKTVGAPRIEPFTAEYPIHYRKDTEMLLSVDDVRELDTDIDDRDPVPVAEADAEPVKSHAETEAEEKARLRGILLHDIMASVTDIDSIDRAVTEVCRRNRLSLADTESTAAFVHSIIEGGTPQVLSWFRDYDRILVEQPIYDPETDDTRRPDRIVFLPDGTVEIVDFKFTSEILPAHRRQVSHYADLLRAMGHTPRHPPPLVSPASCRPRRHPLRQCTMHNAQFTIHNSRC